jgi:DNA polymerase-4
MGRDDRLVTPDQPRRSISVETTFQDDLVAETDLCAALAPLVADLAARVDRAGFAARTVTLKIRYADFSLVTRRRTDPQPLVAREQLLVAACLLLAKRPKPGAPIRLLGVGVSGAVDTDLPIQLGLPLL